MVRRLRCLVLVALCGCGFAAAPPVRYFEVRPPAAESQQQARLPSVMVPDFSCLSAYDHLRVVQRRSPVEVITSRNLQWTTPPGRMLAQGMRVQLESTGRFETVRRDVMPRPPYIIEGQVQAIELSSGSPMTARLALHINVRRSADGAVIGEESIDDTAEAGGGDVTAGVLELRDLYGRILAGLSARIAAVIEEDLRARGGSA